MLSFETAGGRLRVELQRLVVAGWTGRDADAVKHHVEELAAIGVPRPSQIPLFYQVSPELATQEEEIFVLGEETSGEAEPLLLKTHGRLWIGLASDHTDRWLETTSVAHSKQVCPKVLSKSVWPFEDFAGRLDRLKLSTLIDGETPYQDGNLSRILPLSDLLKTAGLGENEAMLCGTLPAIGGVRPAERYKMTLADEREGEISLSYRVKPLSVIS